MKVEGQVGPQIVQDGAFNEFRLGRTAEQIVQELHGRFYEQAYRGVLFSGGMTTTSISNATFTTADANNATLATAATSTPICGIYNPSTSTVNAVILQATLSLVNSAATETGLGGLVWVAYTGNSAISTGSNPVNRKTLVALGSQCKNLAGVALTGLASVSTGIMAASALSQPFNNFSFVGTAAGAPTFYPASVENIDGSIIVPPGGVLGLFCVTTPVAWSAAASLLWEEVAI
jgi:hypothetical protein